MTSKDLTQLDGNWNYPTAIRFGIGRISELADACFTLGMRRPLLVTDPGLAALPMIGAAREQCCAAGLTCEIFSQIKSNPNEDNVNAGVEAFRDAGHDGVIAFGGGSALDAGKAIALMAGQLRLRGEDGESCRLPGEMMADGWLVVKEGKERSKGIQ